MAEGLTFLDLTRDILALISSSLHVREIVALSSTCHFLRRTLRDHSGLWSSLCVRLLGHAAPVTRTQMTTQLGLAGNTMTWREFFQFTYGSEVLTWGSGGGRTGHDMRELALKKAAQRKARGELETRFFWWCCDNCGGSQGDRQTHVTGEPHPSRETPSECAACGELASWNAVFDNADNFVEEPTVLETLSRQAIYFVGKTAEVGSIAVSMGGARIFVWGDYAKSVTPVMLLASSISPIPNDRVVEASCGHDSAFILIFNSGLVFAGRFRHRNDQKETHLREDHFENFSKLIIGESTLNEGEKAIQSLGSQSGRGGVLTNQGRVLHWSTWDAERYCLDMRIEPFAPPSQPSPSLPEDAALEVGEAPVDPQRPKKSYSIGILDPIAGDTRLPIKIAKAAFGHRLWFAITDSGELYQMEIRRLSSDPGGWFGLFGTDGEGSDETDDQQEQRPKPKPVVAWTRVAYDNCAEDPVIMADSGSAHHAMCTASGAAFTWGCTAFGMLGHGEVAGHEIDQPRRVEFFQKEGKRVVAVGAGGYISWDGSFTLFLCHDNTLYRAGMLGSRSESSLPLRIISPSVTRRSILSISCGEDWAAIVVSAKASAKAPETEAEKE